MLSAACDFDGLLQYKYQRIHGKPIYAAIEVVHPHSIAFGHRNTAHVPEVTLRMLADFLPGSHQMNLDAVIRNNHHNLLESSTWAVGQP